LLETEHRAKKGPRKNNRRAEGAAELRGSGQGKYNTRFSKAQRSRGESSGRCQGLGVGGRGWGRADLSPNSGKTLSGKDT